MALAPQISPITHRIPAVRQEAKRHYGVHPYFTRRPANVVRSYIEHFTRPGDVVLDPFGGSGVTAIEAMLLNRRGIQNDINPLANFIAVQVADTTYEDTKYVKQGFLEVEDRCKELVRRIQSMEESEVIKRLKDVDLPENIQLPQNSDAERYFDLFTPRQLLALAVLKCSVDKVADPSARGALLLAWSATLGKLNKTFLSAHGRLESRGGSSIFSIYRYKLAKTPVELPPWEVFRERTTNVITGKEEVLKQKRLMTATEGWRGNFEALCHDVRDLPQVIGHKVDYIFTDPPYGGHIAYLDLSILWNHWLGFHVNKKSREREIIVGGELHLSEEHYLKRLRESIHVCAHMLKKNRWFSVVFQHWNVRYFETILEAAQEGGANLKASVTQIGDPVWSMHKKKNKQNVLAGEMILTFHKNGERASFVAARKPIHSIEELIDESVKVVSPDGRPFAGELLFNQMIVKAWNRGALRFLDLSRGDLSEILKKRGWRYNPARHQWVNDAETVSSDLQLTF